MLPGFRFLFAAIALAVSLLVFGLGAAALLRTAHEQFTSVQTVRPPPITLALRSADAPTPTLSLLRVEPQAIATTTPTVVPTVAAAQGPTDGAMPAGTKAAEATPADSKAAETKTTEIETPAGSASASVADATAPQPRPEPAPPAKDEPQRQASLDSAAAKPEPGLDRAAVLPEPGTAPTAAATPPDATASTDAKTALAATPPAAPAPASPAAAEIAPPAPALSDNAAARAAAMTEPLPVVAALTGPIPMPRANPRPHPKPAVATADPAAANDVTGSIDAAIPASEIKPLPVARPKPQLQRTVKKRRQVARRRAAPAVAQQTTPEFGQ